MNVLIIGSGGREHALAWKCAQDDFVEHVSTTVYPEEYVNPVFSHVPVVMQSPVNLIYLTHIFGFCGSPENLTEKPLENKSLSGSGKFTGTFCVVAPQLPVLCTCVVAVCG